MQAPTRTCMYEKCMRFGTSGAATVEPTHRRVLSSATPGGRPEAVRNQCRHRCLQAECECKAQRQWLELWSNLCTLHVPRVLPGPGIPVPQRYCMTIVPGRNVVLNTFSLNQVRKGSTRLARQEECLCEHWDHYQNSQAGQGSDACRHRHANPSFTLNTLNPQALVPRAHCLHNIRIPLLAADSRASRQHRLHLQLFPPHSSIPIAPTPNPNPVKIRAVPLRQPPQLRSQDPFAASSRGLLPRPP